MRKAFALLQCVLVQCALMCFSMPGASAQEAEGARDAVEAAQPAPVVATIPKTRLYLADLSIIRLGPLGLETQNRLVLQRRLRESNSVLFRDTYINGALSLKLNPAYFKIGPTFDLQPIALLHMRAGYEFMRYFGSFGYLQSFPEPTTENSFELEVRDAQADAGENYVTAGHHLFFEPTLQVKAGKIAIRSKLAIEYWKMALENGDKVFYDATLHTLVPADGFVIANDSDLLYVSGKRLTAGIRYSGVFPQYDAGDFQGDAIPEDAISGSHHKLGPLIAWSFNTRDYTRWNRPTLLLVVGYYLSHPNAEESKSPYILLGFGFNSDFLQRR